MTSKQEIKKSVTSAMNSGRRSFLTGAAVTAAAFPLILTSKTANAYTVDGRTVRHFRDIQRHENDHVTALEGALGSSKRPRPTFKALKTTDITTFFKMAQAFENVGVGAYLNAAPAIADPAYLGAAAQIALIEARHAGYLNTFLETRITVNAYGRERSFELGLNAAQVNAAIKPYVASLNGGKPVTYSDQQDIDILNFALALEYLEQEFYNLNVPYFFGADVSTAEAFAGETDEE